MSTAAARQRPITRRDLEEKFGQGTKARPDFEDAIGAIDLGSRADPAQLIPVVQEALPQ